MSRSGSLFSRSPRISLALATLCVLAVCSDLGPGDLQQDELREAQELWQLRRPARYEYTVRRQCFCTEDALGPVRVSVDA